MFHQEVKKAFEQRKLEIIQKEKLQKLEIMQKEKLQNMKEEEQLQNCKSEMIKNKNDILASISSGKNYYFSKNSTCNVIPSSTIDKDQNKKDQNKKIGQYVSELFGNEDKVIFHPMYAYEKSCGKIGGTQFCYEEDSAYLEFLHKK